MDVYTEDFKYCIIISQTSCNFAQLINLSSTNFKMFSLRNSLILNVIKRNGDTCLRTSYNLMPLTFQWSILDSQYIRLCKIAVAVAIIKNCPKNLTPEQYTTRLCAKHHQRQVNWTQKNQQLQQEVTSLKQKLILAESRELTNGVLPALIHQDSIDTYGQRGNYTTL